MMKSSYRERPLYEVKANLFKGLAHPVRIRVLEVLSSAPEVPVSELLADSELEASHLSQHLAVLRKHNLVLAERRQSQVFYRLAYPEIAELLSVARSLLSGILSTSQQHLATLATDQKAPRS
jgi:ArsR family transcriptional regulator